MNIWSWLLKKIIKEPVKRSLEVKEANNKDVSGNTGHTSISEELIMSVKVTPELDVEDAIRTEAELLAGYKKAVRLKKDGKVLAAEKILIHSCEPPSIYKAHYKELFRIWRQYNRDDLKVKKYRKVLDRVLKMRKFDNEMVAELLRYWGEEKRQPLPEDSFDADRNLLVSDVKALKLAAEALQENKNIELADSLIVTFSKK